MNTIQNKWESFSKLVIPNVSQIQYSEMQKAFYAGVSAAISVMIDVSADEISEDAGANIFQGLIEECDLFYKNIR